ncbi:MAG: outer membrane protein assembly factor BamA [Bacteroidales bacterium]|nr:outer membrane protein assembly factor BamA [Bacteroidales bacterium]
MLLVLAAAALWSPVSAQGVVVDYNRPQSYVVGGMRVEGISYFSEGQILQLTGIRNGDTVTVPSDQLSSIVRKLWQRKYFENISITIDSLSAGRDTAYFLISLTERPRISKWIVSGVKTGEQKDIAERVTIKRGSEYSEYLAKANSDIIKKYYKEKGFLKVDVTPLVKRDSVIRNAVRVNFVVDKGPKVKVKTITFDGNDHIKDDKLARSMKKTRDRRFVSFFKSKKFDEKEYPEDKKHLIETFNEEGFRDARIVKDSIYYLDDKFMQIDFVFDEGKRYYFRNITWTGNSVFSTEMLDGILNIQKGDPYDVVTMEKRLFGGGKQNEYDVSKLYRDNGYLFFSMQPVELMIEGDSVDVQMRISEGKQATLNNIIINGNDLTNERVVRRQVYTRPGYLFSQSDFESSIREISSMGQFDPEAISDPSKGWAILPNSMNNTVDIVYNVTEKPSSQLELSGGWGGNTFVGTLGLSFNNFSTRRFFDKTAWRPVPLGDAQNLSIRFQTSGTYYTSLSASFMEPWLTGKKPISLSLSAYYTRQTNSYVAIGFLNDDQYMNVYGFAASLGKRLKWPDRNFTLYHQLSWQTYELKDWRNYFMFDTGKSHNVSYSINLSRTSTDQQIYPREGSTFSVGLQLTPPFSLMRKDWKSVDWQKMSAADHYKWIEYHKWTFKSSVYTRIVGDLVLMASANFGYLGYYNRNWGYSPFEGFLVGGDGMSGYNFYGADVISLRGYENYSLTETIPTESSYAYAGYVYDKFTVEFRYPVLLQPQSTIFALIFVEGGNCWSDIKKFNPFQIKRSAGVGVRVFLPMVGLLGVDWGYGFDDPVHGKSQFHFVIGQQF